MHKLMMVVVGVVGAVVAWGCVRDHLVPCGDNACPANATCIAEACVGNDQLVACVGLSAGDPCNAVANGHCIDGVCRSPICGNAVVDVGETCDDGNVDDADGCSARCDSTEVCGNGVPDYLTGEACDRGLAGLSNDGCSSTCVVETELWRDVTPFGISPRLDFGMTYDPVRQRVLVFGGTLGFLQPSPLGDTWEWDGATWFRHQPLTSPSPRFSTTMVYDASRNRVVLFGGRGGNTLLGDTWEWDGITWTERLPPTSPTARAGHQLAYDDDRQRVVLFGGYRAFDFEHFDIADVADDLWEWDGTTWALQVPSGIKPTARANHAMAYDSKRDRLVITGGTANGSTSLADTWEWDGVSWTPPAATTPATRSACATFDPVSDQVVVFGGVDSRNDPTSTLRMWSGTAWSQAYPSVPPPDPPDPLEPIVSRRGCGIVRIGRRLLLFGGDQTNHDVAYWDGLAWSETREKLPAPDGLTVAMTYDSQRGRVVMIESRVADSPRAFENTYTTFWEWDGATWILGPYIMSPTQDRDAAITYDPDRAVSIILVHSDLWEWDGTTLVQIDSTAPEIAHHALVYDAARHELLLIATGTTWAWNGISWSSRDNGLLLNSPTAVYDTRHEQVVLHATTAGSVAMTWVWDGSSWSVIAASETPQRFQGQLAYDATRGQPVLYGGLDANGTPRSEMFDWSGTSWTARQPLTAPTTDNNFAITYDAQHGTLLRIDAVGTWRFAFESAIPFERCVAGLDTDGDALTGCADPDCWARCTPTCAPGMTCDPTQPHCGDGTCSMLEDYLLCPSDCVAP